LFTYYLLSPLSGKVTIGRQLTARCRCTKKTLLAEIRRDRHEQGWFFNNELSSQT